MRLKPSSWLAACMVTAALLSVAAGTVLVFMDASETAARGQQAGRGSEYSLLGAVAINTFVAGIFIMPAGIVVGIIGWMISRQRKSN